MPAGALADIVDRRKLLLISQVWMLIAAASLAVLTAMQLITPASLLAITFALGIGFALNAPAWQAIVPELVSREQLDSAVTLSGIGVNVARAIGPAIGGVIVAASGPQAAFALNSVTFVAVLIVLYRWKNEKSTTELPRERISGAMIAGLRYVQHSPAFQSVLVRTLAFIFFGSALWAHLPLIARDQIGVAASGYGLLLGAIGVGAVLTAFVLPRIRDKISTNLLVTASSISFAITLMAMGFVTSLVPMCVLLLPVGAFWVVNLSSLNVSAQTATAPWVKARALSVYLLVFFGGMSFGAIFWGAVAGRVGIQNSLGLAAVGMLFAVAATLRFRLASADKSGLLPSCHWPIPIVTRSPNDDDGPVIVTVEYQITEENRAAFLDQMKLLRRARIRTGAYRWYLSCDLANDERWVEIFFVPSWAEHQRQHSRVSFEDAAIQAQIAELHSKQESPTVTHSVVNFA